MNDGKILTQSDKSQHTVSFKILYRGSRNLMTYHCRRNPEGFTTKANTQLSDILHYTW